MTKRKMLAHNLVAELDLLSDPPAVLSTEDPDAYRTLRDSIARALKARDAVEAVLVTVFADLAWENRRLRTVTSEFIDQGRRTALERAGKVMSPELLEAVRVDPPDFSPPELPTRSRSRPAPEPEAPPPPPEPAVPLGPISDDFRENFEVLERLGKMQASIERRMYQAIAAINGYQTTFALRARQVAKQIIDGEFDEVTTVPADPVKTDHDVPTKN